MRFCNDAGDTAKRRPSYAETPDKDWRSPTRLLERALSAGRRLDGFVSRNSGRNRTERQKIERKTLTQTHRRSHVTTVRRQGVGSRNVQVDCPRGRTDIGHIWIFLRGANCMVAFLFFLRKTRDPIYELPFISIITCTVYEPFLRIVCHKYKKQKFNFLFFFFVLFQVRSNRNEKKLVSNLYYYTIIKLVVFNDVRHSKSVSCSTKEKLILSCN